MAKKTVVVGQVSATVERNKSIHLVGVYSNKSVNIEFGMGDMAEYDSYNLSYLGQIVGITDKTVSIRPRYEKAIRRLKLSEFIWRNYNFNLAEVERANHETSLYI